MKILLAVPHFPPRRTAGAELLAQRTARGLIHHGHQVRVVCIEDMDSQTQNTELTWRDEVYDGIPVRRLFFDLANTPNPLRGSFDNPVFEEHFSALISVERPDLLHLISGYLVGVAPIRAAKKSGIPVIVYLTDFWFLCPTLQLVRGDGSLCSGPEPIECARCLYDIKRRFRFPDRRAPGMMRKFWQTASRYQVLGKPFGLPERMATLDARQDLLCNVLGSADAVVAPTRFIAQVHAAKCAEPLRSTLVPYSVAVRGLPELQTRVASSELRVGYLGQVVPVKGVDVLVRAFRQLNRSRRRARLSIHGSLSADSSYVRHLRNLAHNDPDIIFADRYEHVAVARLLSELDVVVVPSIWYENAPHVILEAFAAQRPVIGTNLGGIAEIVQHEVNGLLFERKNVIDLARQMQRILDEPDLLSRLQEGIPPVRTVEQEMSELMDVYGQVLTKYPATKAKESG